MLILWFLIFLTMTELTKIVFDFVKDNPDIPSHTLAKIIYFKNPQIFKDVESIRTTVRYFRGKRGKDKLKSLIKTYGKLF